MTEPAEPTVRIHRLRVLAAIAFLLFSFAITLPSLEFSSGSENIVAATAMEIRRDGHWLLPTLNGEPRVRKPPLTAWIAAASISDDTIHALDSPGNADAFRSLALRMRLHLVVLVGIVGAAAFRLARSMQLGPRSLVVAGVVVSSLILLRFGRSVTTDSHLLLWVALANAGLAAACLERFRWIGCVVAGVSLGFAFMTKGPVCLVQTLAPWAVVLLARRAKSPGVAPLLTMLGLLLAVALPWFVLAWLQSPNVLHTWFVEVHRVGATDLGPDPIFAYASLLPLAFPWAVFLIVGFVDVSIHWRTSKLFPALMLLVVPIVIMSFFPDRKERYLLPMIVPAAILAARGVEMLFANAGRFNAVDRLVFAGHWLAVGIVAVGLPVAGMFVIGDFRRLDGTPWYSPSFALPAAVISAAILVLGVMSSRRSESNLVASTVLLMAVVNFVFLAGYQHSREGRSELKPLADAILTARPDAKLFRLAGTNSPSDLSIYANRIVSPIASISDLPRDENAVLVVGQSHRDPVPEFEHLVPLADVPRDRNRWWAFVRRPEGATP